MIIVLGNALVREQQMPLALKLSLEHVHRSRAEPGCISHAVHVDCENPLRLVFVEKWADKASLDAHFNVPESGEFVSELSAILTEPPEMVIYQCESIGA